ncbi:hypothetical protein AKO1_010409 [Acrasis kona]|uniref:alpha-1,6-mannosyl-glycoprotein 6-beta-N-acetylglucosaminyltransferase n=1 Tax=Acrasis kona TaxID=1008807 RepID=A0AAW2YXA4_9EUKA
MIFSDYYSMETVQPDILQQLKHKFRFLDFWGTNQHIIDTIYKAPFHQEQFLTPYKNSFNSFLGIAINPLPQEYMIHVKNKQQDQLQILLWGKDNHYFAQEHWDLIHKIREQFPNIAIHSTIQRLWPGQPNITNHKVLKHNEWTRLLAQSNIIMGVGWPVIGPTVLEAIAAGCVYMNKKDFYAPQHHETLHFDSQHPYARDLFHGPPLVYDVDHNQHQQVMNTIRTIIDRRKQIQPTIHPDYTMNSVVRRLQQILGNNKTFIT